MAERVYRRGLAIFETLSSYGITLIPLGRIPEDEGGPATRWKMKYQDGTLASIDIFKEKGGTKIGYLSWPAQVSRDQAEELSPKIQALFARREGDTHWDEVELYGSRQPTVKHRE